MTDDREPFREALSRAPLVPAVVRLPVARQPYGVLVGQVEQHDAGWTAHTPRRTYVGLFPDKQAAAQALVKKAGYELL